MVQYIIFLLIIVMSYLFLMHKNTNTLITIEEQSDFIDKKSPLSGFLKNIINFVHCFVLEKI